MSLFSDHDGRLVTGWCVAGLFFAVTMLFSFGLGFPSNISG